MKLKRAKNKELEKGREYLIKSMAGNWYLCVYSYFSFDYELHCFYNNGNAVFSKEFYELPS